MLEVARVGLDARKSLCARSHATARGTRPAEKHSLSQEIPHCRSRPRPTVPKCAPGEKSPSCVNLRVP
jgi:hypothetical protein